MDTRLLQIQTASDAASRNFFFAYGANMNPVQIKKRCSSPVHVAAAFLPDHRIGFYGHSAEWNGGLETAVKAEGSQLWGVVYALSDLDWERIDLWQDARFDGTGRYFHYPVEVCDLRGNHYEARMYKMDVLGPARPPSKSYIQHILDGARENGLPPAYIDNLLAIEATPAQHAVLQRMGYDPAASAGASCASCNSAY